MTQVTFGFPSAPAVASYVTIGTYDGLHRGHLSIIKPLVERARAEAAASVLVTFEPHPRCVLDPDHCPPNLTTLDEKSWLLDQLGLDRLLVIPFTPQVAGLGPAAFMQRLMKGLDVRNIMVGQDFAFGRGRRGDPAFLRRFGGRHGFSVDLLPRLDRGREPISSSRIRRLILLGQVRAASQLLGRDYFIRSIVEHGAGRGRGLGFPTANLQLASNKLLPANGVYAVRVGIDDEVHLGAMSIGFRPTFGGNSLTAEVFVFDFAADLYGKRLTVWCVQRLRGEKRYASVPALQQQMGRDVENARRILGGVTSNRS